MATDIPLACSLSADELRARVQEIAPIFTRADGVVELPDGYRFAFPAAAEGAHALLDFILVERACCPFFTFELTFPSPHEVVWLAVRGREGVKEIVRESFVARITEPSPAQSGAAAE